MTRETVRRRYFANKFIDTLRLHLIVDEHEWTDLESVLRDLAREWRGQGQIDKDVARDLFAIGRVVRGAAQAFEDDPQRSVDLLNRAEHLEGLILEALD